MSATVVVVLGVLAVVAFCVAWWLDSRVPDVPDSQLDDDLDENEAMRIAID